MKKILAILLSLFVMFISLFAYAAEVNPFTAEFSHDKENNVYIVSGTLTSSMGNVPMLLTVTDSNGDFYTGLQTLAVRNGTKVTYAFDALSFPADVPTGDYTICVSSEFYDYTEDFKISVLKLSEQWEFLSSMNTLINAGGDGIYDLVKGYAKYLGLSEAAFCLDDDSKKVYDKFIKICYDIPDVFDGDDILAVTKLESAWRVCTSDTFNALAAATLVDIKDANDTKAWLDTYYNALGLNLEDKSTTYSEEKINGYFKEVRVSTEFSERMAAVKSVDKTEDMKRILNEITLLTAIDTMQYTAVSDIILGFGELFPIDEDLFDDLDSDQIGAIFTDMAGVNYGNYAFAADAFEELAEDYLSDDDDGGSGGGSGSKGGNLFFGNDKEEIAKEEQKNIMTDISEAEWAREAIEALVSKGIINGRGNGKFAPNDNITRAEFIKIVVSALEFDTPFEDPCFDDVSVDSWYAPYVAAAKKAGIVTGNDKNMFSPNSFISRQDMAVILYRAYGFEKSDKSNEIPDYDAISAYAEDAVATLYAKGVINGMGDGRFAPHSNATRAQAAQMIYKIIK